jgi:hypothetical protein
MATTSPRPLNRARAALGLVTSGLLLLSGGVHLALGWPAVQAELGKASAPHDLISGIMVAWQFGGTMMLALSGLMGRLFLHRWQGRDSGSFPASIVGIAYVLFGMWAMISLGFQAFFFVFIGPGLLLLIAASPR